MRKTLRRLSISFCEDQRYNGDESTVGFVIFAIHSKKFLMKMNKCTIFSADPAKPYFPLPLVQRYSAPQQTNHHSQQDKKGANQ